MKLIGSLTSPFVRKVRAVLTEKKIDYEFVVDSPWEAATSVPGHNPLGKVPVLILDDGSVIYDSRVIVEHLDNATPNARLFPTSNRERIQIKVWEALADGICDAAATVFLERKRPAEQQSEAWIERQMQKVNLGLKAMSDALGTHTWCSGNGLCVGDIAFGCALGYLAFRFPEIDWRSEYPNLARHFDDLMRRSSFRDTVPQG